MLKKLKRTFVLLSTALTGLVLLAACIFAYYFAKVQIERAGSDAFEHQSQTLGVLLAGTNRLDHSQIARMERENDMTLYLFDNGNPIRIASGSDSIFRTGLYDAALAALGKIDTTTIVTPNQRYGEPVNYTAPFSYDGSEYLAKFISTPTGVRQWYSVVLVKPLAGQNDEITRLVLLYTCIFVGGLALLGLISWILAKRSVQPVEQAQQKQKDFIATASHELKSPLAVITSSVDVARQNSADTTRCLTTIYDEAGRMTHLVDDLLMLAGADTGKWTIQKAPANIDDILASTYERFLPIAKQKGHSLILELPKNPLPEVKVDEERIIQVLSILLSNATSYSPRGGEICLTAQANKKTVILSVQDHGPGISQEEKNHIFDSFYRAQHSHSDKSHFGLGLAVAKELVALHKGNIDVTDTPGGGATFTVILPKGNEEGE